MRDSFGREITYLRLSVTDLCNLRCRYCMPQEGVCKKQHAQMLTEEEMLCAVRAAAQCGISKLRLTGGEPLVKKNILSLAAHTAAVPGIREVALTTNGSLLAQLAKPLRQAGVQRINISLDTLDAEKYAYITRGGALGAVKEGFFAALEAGFQRVKLNAVLMGGFNEEEIPALAALTQRYPVDVRFIELMPMCGAFSSAAYLSADTVLRRLPALAPLHEADSICKYYTLPDAQGRVGLITPISNHFCAACNRIRLTADGKLRPCLHSPAEFALKGKTEAQMCEAFRAAILAKPEWHGALSGGECSRAGRDMNEIGG